MAGPKPPALFPEDPLGGNSGKRRGRPPGSKNAPKAARTSPGRVERALATELRDSAVSPAAAAHLRAAAAFVDTAETAGAVADGTKAVLAYLQLRQAYGLAGAATTPLDPFAAFVAGMAVPGPGLRDPENP